MVELALGPRGGEFLDSLAGFHLSSSATPWGSSCTPAQRALVVEFLEFVLEQRLEILENYGTERRQAERAIRAWQALANV